MKFVICFSLVFTIAFCNHAFCSNWEPWDNVKNQSLNPYTKHHTSFLQRTSLGLIKIYQKFFSEVIGSRCPMWPSCSCYSRAAIEKHGVLLGIVMTADRLIHEIEEIRYAPIIKTPKGLRYSDPLEENDYWHSNSEKK